MFETSISKPHRQASFASVLLHAAMAVTIFTLAGTPVIQRKSHTTMLFLPLATPKLARRETRQPSKPVFKQVPKFAIAPKLHSAPPPVDLGLPETLPAPRPPIPPTPVIVGGASPIPAMLPPPLPMRKLEVHTGGFESTPTPVSHLTSVAIDLQPSALNLSAVPAPRAIHSPVSSGEAFGAADPGVAPARPKATVAVTQFDAVDAKPAPHGVPLHAKSSLTSPLEIISKPRPIYTEEGRRLHIEGDVVLQVSFRASSEICVLRVIRGLGHGLDASAIAAAAAIRFRPAIADGHPVDEVATVRITFQLAE